MQGEPGDDELEVVPLDDVARPPPRPSPWRTMAARVGRHRRPLLLAVVVVALLATSYTAFAVRGLRALERHTRSAIVLREQYDAYVAELRPVRPTSYRLLAGEDADARVRRATADYGFRMAELAERARDVAVVDHALRRLRRRTVTFLRDEAARARTASTRTSPWLSPIRFDTTQLQGELRRWRRPPGSSPDVPGLAGVTAAVVSAPLLDEPTGARLFVPTREGLLEVDVDHGVVHTHGDGGGVQWAIGDGFVATVEGGNGLVREFGGRSGPRTLGRYDLVFRDADDPTLAWFVTGPLDPGDTRRTEVRAFDRHGVRRDEILPDDGSVTAVSARWLVRGYYGDRDEVVVDNRRTGQPAARLRSARFHALRGTSLVWSDDARLLVRDLARGTDRTVAPPRPGMTAWTVEASPDGGRLAVVWALVRGRDGDAEVVGDVLLTVHETASLRDVAVLRVADDPVHQQPAWSRDGSWLFVLAAGDSAPGRVVAWRDGLTEPKTVQIEGQFYGLSAY